MSTFYGKIKKLNFREDRQVFYPNFVTPFYCLYKLRKAENDLSLYLYM